MCVGQETGIKLHTLECISWPSKDSQLSIHEGCQLCSLRARQHHSDAREGTYYLSGTRYTEGNQRPSETPWTGSKSCCWTISRERSKCGASPSPAQNHRHPDSSSPTGSEPARVKDIKKTNKTKKKKKSQYSTHWEITHKVHIHSQTGGPHATTLKEATGLTCFLHLCSLNDNKNYHA